MSNSSNSNVNTGMSFAGVLTVVFVVLKLVGVINWSWIWVLSPIWIGWIITLILIIAIIWHYEL